MWRPAPSDLHRLVGRAWRAANTRVDRGWDSLSESLWEFRQLHLPHRPSRGEMNAILRRMGRSSYSEYRALERAGQFGRRSFIPADRNAFVVALRDRFPSEASAIVQAADATARGTFDLLGSGPVDMRRSQLVGAAPGWKIDWDRDPISGGRFRRRFSQWRADPSSLRIARSGLNDRPDIKGLWELSRSQHFATLGTAWWLTGDRRYPEAFAGFVRDHIRRNPPQNGAHWSCPMDVAIRAINWIVGVSFFQGAAPLDDRWWDHFIRSMLEHGRVIAARLEYGTIDSRVVGGNHLLSDLVGLHWISLAFPDLDPSKSWRGITEGLLEREIQTQILPDGADFESSVPYQRLVVELLLSSYAMSLVHNAPLSAAYRDRLLQSLRFIRSLRQPGGRQPQIGDADNGRAHILCGYGSWSQENMDHLLAAGARVLECPSLAEDLPADSLVEALFWDVGRGPSVAPSAAPSATNTAPNAPAIDTQPHRSVELFPSSGLTIARAGPTYALLSNGPVGCHGFGNHKHNDQLAVEWIVREQPLLVDGGTHTYTQNPPSRNRFRSTAMHNTVSIDGRDQHTMEERYLFRLWQEGAMRTTVRDVAIPEGGERWLMIDAEHTAYARLDPAFVHRRVLLVDDAGSIIVRDQLEGAGSRVVRWHFLLYPGVTATPIDGGVSLVGARGRGEIVSEDLRFSIEPSHYSSGYGSISATSCLIATRCDDPRSVTILLRPDGAAMAGIAVARAKADRLLEIVSTSSATDPTRSRSTCAASSAS